MYAGAADAVVCQHHALGGEGAIDLANAVIKATKEPPKFNFLYELDLPIKVCAQTIPVLTFNVIILTSRLSSEPYILSYFPLA